MEAARRLEGAGWQIEVKATSAVGHATELARMAAGQGVDAVLACGGDGTAREVAEGIAHTSTALGVLPAGTANVWAHEAGIPMRLEAALALATRARRVRIDTGLANGHRFLLMCSTGLDAAVVRAMEGGASKRALGRVAYALDGVRRAALTRGVAASIEVDGVRLERDVLMAVAGNTRLFGMVARVTAEARADDGVLDVCVLSGGAGDSPGRRLGIAWSAVRGRLPEIAARGAGGVDYSRGRVVRLTSESPIDVQADGDWIGQTPVQIEVDAASLWVLVAPGANPLFG
jgi:diacylglycerol kinase (ATP)